MAEAQADREIVVNVRVATMPDCPDGLSNVACLRCGKALDIHQPDSENPDRMLATCPGLSILAPDRLRQRAG